MKLRPNFVYPTHGGTFFNLTPFNQKDLSIEFTTLFLNDLVRFELQIKNLPKQVSFRSFFNLQDKKIVFSPVEFYNLRTRGCDNKEIVQVDSFGWKDVSIEKYFEFIRIGDPDIVVGLTEQSRGEGGRKSIKRTQAKSTLFLDKLIKFKEESKLRFEIFAPYIGDFQDDLRKESFNVIFERISQIDGIFLTGMFFKDKNSKFESRKLVYQSLNNIKVPVFLSSPGDIFSVLEGKYFGVSYFEAGFPFETAKKFQAISFSLKQWKESTQHLINNKYQISSTQIEQFFHKNDRFDKETPLIDLSNPCFSKDMRPLVEDCSCYACKTISRAYIHHLIVHHEMTANVLLVIHNCWTYARFFEILNEVEESEHLDAAIFAFHQLFLH